MRYWLARLSFSFLIIAAVAGYDVYTRRPISQLRLIVDSVAAGGCFALFLTGVRARHGETGQRKS